jgi:hypothetical protein
MVQLSNEQGRVETATVLDMTRSHADTHDPTTPAHDSLPADGVR